MTTQTDQPVCGVMGCGLTREAHAGRQHQFSEEGILKPLEKPPARKPMSESVGLAALIMRLLAVLLKKGVIDERELGIITTGSDGGSPSRPEDLPSRREG